MFGWARTILQSKGLFLSVGEGERIAYYEDQSISPCKKFSSLRSAKLSSKRSTACQHCTRKLAKLTAKQKETPIAFSNSALLLGAYLEGSLGSVDMEE